MRPQDVAYEKVWFWWKDKLDTAQGHNFHSAMSQGTSGRYQAQVDLLWELGEELLGVTPPSRETMQGQRQRDYGGRI